MANVLPSIDAGNDASINEGETFTGHGSFTDPGSDSWIATVDYGDGSGLQDLVLNLDMTFDLEHLYADDGTYTVTVEVSDDDGCESDNLVVLVSNLPPVIEQISLLLDPIPVNTVIEATADFLDPGILDLHTATWDWDDDSSSNGIVVETNGIGVVTGNHMYTTPGVYTVRLNVSDGDGGIDEEIFQYVVVYDPEGGFVTGGGWITSPEGAYYPDPTLTGKATFGFISKYKKGTTIPTGNTEFQFHAGDLNFHSNDYDWLVVTGSDYAMFKGTGTINNQGEFKFRIWAGDGQPDTFRIKIWEEDEFGVETVIYDNGFDQSIEGGSIVIHTKNK